MRWLESIQSALKSYSVAPEVHLNKLVSENPQYPYRLLHVRKFEIRQRYKLFYFHCGGIIVSLSVIIAWIITGALDGHSIHHPLFLIPIAALLVFVVGALMYMDIKTYALYPTAYQYSFSINGKDQIKGDFHNIYVRLRREPRSGMF
jgi:hypothetical protein